jgi:type VI secretion system secreted protein VgrG
MNAPGPGFRLPTLTVELRCADLPAIGVVVRKLELDERIDGDYRAKVVLASDEEFTAKSLLGADCELVWNRELIDARSLFGVIERVEDLGEVDHRQFIRIEVVPAFALLDYGQNSRIWQHKSVRDIVKAVLEPALDVYGRKVQFAAVKRGTRVRDYCVQYKESDYAFARRLLEEEGIAYAYVHKPKAGVEALTLYDGTLQYAVLDEPVIPMIDHDAGEADIESIQGLGHACALTVTTVLRRDYNWLEPLDLLSESKLGVDARYRERRIYLHERRRYVGDDLRDRVSDALAAELVAGETLRGKGNVARFVPGTRFKLFNGGSDLDGEYVLARVVHEYTDTESEPGTYGNQFECFPVEVDYRPRQQIEKPRVHGPHTATVVGDDEIHTDEHGRIQVQFHWEESPSNVANASCWIRCAQSWSGAGWGTQFIPRVGMEVVVEFLEGNPDRPLVTGCVFNGVNDFPFDVPGSKTQSGWRTRSSPESEGYNMLRFEDAAGSEEIHIHGQRNWSIVIRSDKTQQIGHDETLHVGHDRLKTVDHDEYEKIGNMRTITVVQGHKESIGADMSLSVGGCQDESIGGSKTVTVGGVMATTVGKDMHFVVSEGVTQKNGKKYEMTVGEEFSIVCGAASLVMKCGGEIVLTGTTVAVNGATIDVTATGITTIVGATVQLNP